MKVLKPTKTQPEKQECCTKTNIRWLITEKESKQGTLRLFEMGIDGSSLLHKHPSEHHIYVLSGEGCLFNGETTLSIQTGDAIFIPANEPHQIKNTHN